MSFNIMVSPEVGRGRYYVARVRPLENGMKRAEFVMQATGHLAYALFAKVIIDELEFSGTEACFVVNEKDWESDFWKIKKTLREQKGDETQE